MIDTVVAYLDERAARYGGTAADILDKTPTILWDNPDEIMAFWDANDLSHVFPQSTHPHMADDWNNIVPESSDVNRARGAEIMTHDELVDAELDVLSTAVDIDVATVGDDPGFASELIDVVFA
jgi:hypothetical protein